jgi:FkbM family methyltransferase
MQILNEQGIDVTCNEKQEQDLADTYINDDDVVLELGARYGAVSCTINSKLKNKTNQVVVEPDDRVWEALELNKKRNSSEFYIVKGFISNKKLGLTNLNDRHNGYASTYVEDDNSNIPCYTLQSIKDASELTCEFNVLVADCEGGLEIFLDENPSFYDQIRLIIFEEDYPDKCNYTKIKQTLINKGFLSIHGGGCQVWRK